MMAKKIKLFLALTAFAALVMATGIGQAQTITIEMAGTSLGPEHSFQRVAKDLIDEVDKASGGKIKLINQLSGVHGSEREIVEAVALGTLKNSWSSDLGYATIDPSIGFVNLPYLLPTYEMVDKYYFNGFLGQEFEKRALAKGLRVVCWMENDFRNLTNSRRPITTMEDLKGLKIRVPPFPILLSYFKKLGTLPTPMAITELLTGLQQKTVDGQDNGVILTYAYGLYQPQKYYTTTNHMYSGCPIFFNEKFWQSLSPEHQKILSTAFKRAAARQVAMNRADVAKFKKKMQESGIVFAELTPQTQAEFKKIAREVWQEFESKYDKNIMQRIYKELGK